MRTIKLTLAYDGTDFAGWQCQGPQRTVQATLEATLEKITGQRTPVLASGRTDAGVHALGQVASFETESGLSVEVIQRALNAELPHDVAVLDAVEVRAGFHPTRHTVRKRYRYVVFDGPVRDVFQRRYCWHFYHGRLDAEAMQRAALPLVGPHDFSSFETSGAPRKSSVRTVFELTVERGRGIGSKRGLSSSIATSGLEGKTLDETGTAPFSSRSQGRAGQGGADIVTLEIEANGFLYNMVRAIVGTLVEVGRGARPESWPGEVLAAADRRSAGMTAPPQGLFLVRAEYGEDPPRAE